MKRPLATIAAIVAATGAFASTIDLSGLTGDTVLGDGDVVTGTLNAAADLSLPKTTIEVTPPDPAAPAQFFKVTFGE